MVYEYRTDIDPEYNRLFHIVNDVRRQVLSHIQKQLDLEGCGGAMWTLWPSLY